MKKEICAIVSIFVLLTVSCAAAFAWSGKVCTSEACERAYDAITLIY